MYRWWIHSKASYFSLVRLVKKPAKTLVEHLNFEWSYLQDFLKLPHAHTRSPLVKTADNPKRTFQPPKRLLNAYLAVEYKKKRRNESAWDNKLHEIETVAVDKKLKLTTKVTVKGWWVAWECRQFAQGSTLSEQQAPSLTTLIITQKR